MKTFYQTTVDSAPRFPALEGECDADVVVVGGGFAGLAAALGLVERGFGDVMLLEAQAIGHGASGRNGGFVSAGFSLDAPDLVDLVGQDHARRLYRLTEDAVRMIRQRIRGYGIECDVVDGGILVADWFDDERPLRRLQHLMRDVFELDWRWIAREELRSLLLTERYHSGLCEADGFHFNPLKYAQGEARVLAAAGVRIHERSRVTSLASHGAGWTVQTATATVRSRHVVATCGGYIDRFFPALSRAVLPIATYVMATEPLGERLKEAMRTDAAVFDNRFAFDYYRPLSDTRLLWGGRMSIRERSTGELIPLLTGDLLRVYPQLRGVKVTHAWSGLMGYSRHEMPQIGRLPSGIWYAMGFGGHGVAAASLGGELVARALSGDGDIPADFSGFGLSPTYGGLGRLAAQLTYWWLQGRDVVRERL